MNDVLHANIFFLIASIATVAFAILTCVVMYYVIKILKSIQAIIKRIEDGSDMIAEDMSAMRQFVTSGGLVAHLIGLVSTKHRAKKRSSTKVHDETSDES
jgi:hypothetical protein